jgi:hypothetical protein
MRRLGLNHVVFVGALTVLLAGCGGGGGSTSTGQSNAPPPSASNHAPTITGTPITSVKVGEAYSFQPTASDADGNTLTYSATNLPAWASINASTGRVTGTPTSSDVGTFSNVTITVSDGSLTASLAAFAITVAQTGTGSVTLSWTPPTQNADGTGLTDLTGFRVVYGRSATDLSQSITITNPSISTYVIDNLSAGTWYFGVKSMNSQANESAISNIASKTI